MAKKISELPFYEWKDYNKLWTNSLSYWMLYGLVLMALGFALSDNINSFRIYVVIIVFLMLIFALIDRHLLTKRFLKEVE